MIPSQVVADYDDYYDDLTDEDIDDILLTVVAGGLYCDICCHSKRNTMWQFTKDNVSKWSKICADACS